MTDTSGVQPPAPPSPASVPTDTRGNYLAYSVIGLLAVAVLILAFKSIPEGSNGNLFTVIATGILGLAQTVIGFQFGSSKGSQDKNATIAAVTTPAPPPPSA